MYNILLVPSWEQYPTGKWVALQTTIAAVETFVAENPNATQENRLTQKVAELQAANRRVECKSDSAI
jgi:hypothetical protein